MIRYDETAVSGVGASPDEEMFTFGKTVTLPVTSRARTRVLSGAQGSSASGTGQSHQVRIRDTVEGRREQELFHVGLRDLAAQPPCGLHQPSPERIEQLSLAIGAVEQLLPPGGPEPTLDWPDRTDQLRAAVTEVRRLAASLSWRCGPVSTFRPKPTSRH